MLETAAVLGLLEETASDILTLTEEVDEQTFFRSRLTHSQTVKRLATIAGLAGNLPAEVHSALPEIDWAGWQRLGHELAAGSAGPLMIWVAVREGAPLLLNWLRVHRQASPELFALKP